MESRANVEIKNERTSSAIFRWVTMASILSFKLCSQVRMLPGSLSAEGLGGSSSVAVVGISVYSPLSFLATAWSIVSGMCQEIRMDITPHAEFNRSGIHKLRFIRNEPIGGEMISATTTAALKYMNTCDLGVEFQSAH